MTPPDRRLDARTPPAPASPPMRTFGSPSGDPRPQSADAAPPPTASDALPFLNELRWLINGIVARARNPNGSIRVITRQEFADFEQALRKLEARWQERERDLAAREVALARDRSEIAIRQRELHATADRVEAREQVVAATRTPFPIPMAQGMQAHVALERLRDRLNAQETEMERLRADLANRQKFLEESETVLGRKMEALDQLATLVDQRMAELALREQALEKREETEA